jgi:hypothetical protein
VALATRYEVARTVWRRGEQGHGEPDATAILLLVVIDVADGQKMLLASKTIGSESAEAWRSALDGLIRRGSRQPEFVIADGTAGLDWAIAAVWGGVPVQQCTVHRHRKLLVYAAGAPVRTAPGPILESEIHLVDRATLRRCMECNYHDLKRETGRGFRRGFAAPTLCPLPAERFCVGR